jgi:hypothetical protein
LQFKAFLSKWSKKTPPKQKSPVEKKIARKKTRKNPCRFTLFFIAFLDFLCMRSSNPKTKTFVEEIAGHLRKSTKHPHPPTTHGRNPVLVPDPNRLGGHLLVGRHCEA